MSFTNVQYNTELFNKTINKVLFNIKISDNKEFINLISKDYISISGSSILQIIKEQEYPKSDLDIYINIKYLNKEENMQNINNLVTYLYYNYNNQKIKSLKVIKKNIYWCYHWHHRRDINSEYVCLHQYLKYYISFNYYHKKIELIFINSDIERLMLNTFDYDFIKNHWTNGKIFVHNINSINNQIGIMSLDHLYYRILLNKTEFKNFITRYNKYTNRGFKLFIYKTQINKKMLDYMTDISLNNSYYNYTDIKINEYYPRFIININNTLYDKHVHILKYILIAGIIQKYYKH